MGTPLISIIVPVYNVEQYLSECLDSLINQTYKNIEIVCIDDGSGDSSSEILNVYAKSNSNIKVITTENRGLASARNLGMAEAAGDFLMFVDSDDWIDIDTLASIHQNGLLDDSHIDIICFGTRRVTDGIKTPYRSYKSDTIQPLDNRYALEINVEACGKLYRTSFLRLNSIIFPVGLYYEDITFNWSCLSYANQIATIKNVFYNYRKRDDSIMGSSHKKKPGMAIHHLYNLENIYDVWRENGFWQKHKPLFEFVFEQYTQQGFKYLCPEDQEEFIKNVKSLVFKFNLKPKRFSLTYDIVNDNRIMPFKYRWAKSIRKKLL